MGGRNRPGSRGRHSGGVPADGDGLDVLDQFGVGERNPLTGLYDTYNIPTGQQVNGAEGGTAEVSWDQILGCFDLIVPDFASEYGVRLVEVRATMRWGEFRTLLLGLLSTNSRVFRRFAPPPGPGGGDADA